MSKQAMLSTIDNPFNPFTNFDEWLQYDLEKGINCNSLVASYTNSLPGSSDEVIDSEIEKAIDEIVLSDLPRFNKFGELIHFIKKTN